MLTLEATRVVKTVKIISRPQNEASMDRSTILRLRLDLPYQSLYCFLGLFLCFVIHSFSTVG